MLTYFSERLPDLDRSLGGHIAYGKHQENRGLPGWRPWFIHLKPFHLELTPLHEHGSGCQRLIRAQRIEALRTCNTPARIIEQGAVQRSPLAAYRKVELHFARRACLCANPGRVISFSQQPRAYIIRMGWSKYLMFESSSPFEAWLWGPEASAWGQWTCVILSALSAKDPNDDTEVSDLWLDRACDLTGTAGLDPKDVTFSV